MNKKKFLESLSIMVLVTMLIEYGGALTWITEKKPMVLRFIDSISYK